MKNSAKSEKGVPNTPPCPRSKYGGGERLFVIGPRGRRRVYKQEPTNRKPPAPSIEGLAPTAPDAGHVEAHKASFTEPRGKKKRKVKLPPPFAVAAFVKNYRAADAPDAIKRDCLAALLRLYQPLAFARAGKWKDLRRGQPTLRECDDSLSNAVAFIIEYIESSCDIDADKSKKKTCFARRRDRPAEEITDWLCQRLWKEWESFVRETELDCHEEYRTDPETGKRQHLSRVYKQLAPEFRREPDPLTKKIFGVEVNHFDGVDSRPAYDYGSEYGATDLERAIEDMIYHADGVLSKRQIAKTLDMVDRIFRVWRRRAPDKYKQQPKPDSGNPAPRWFSPGHGVAGTNKQVAGESIRCKTT